jgi:hypothetical protein
MGASVSQIQQKLKRLLKRRQKWVAVLYVIPTVLVLIFAMLATGFRETITSVTARSEIVRMYLGSEVSPANRPTLVLNNVRMVGSAACVSGAFVPSGGTEVKLIRISNDELRVSVDYWPERSDNSPIGDLLGKNRLLEKQVTQPVVFVFTTTESAACRATNSLVRVPIGGRLELGDEQLEGQTLKTARLDVFGVAGFRSLPFGFLEPMLYPAGAVDLPFASRISECIVKKESWWQGNIDARLGSSEPEDRGMLIQAATSAQGFAIVLRGGVSAGSPGTRQCTTAASHDKDSTSTQFVVTTSAATLVSGDPYIAKLFSLSTIVTAVFAAGHWIVSRLRQRRGRAAGARGSQ